MSTKLTQKVSELLVVLISVLVLCAGIIGYGIFTRPNPIPVHICMKREIALEPSSSVRTKIDLAQLLSELRAQQEESIPQEVELTGAALYDSYIYQITSELYPDVDPELIRAIVVTESQYDPDAVNSKSGAMGLTQIKPKWHMQRALSLGVTDLLDPYGNILVCCDLLHDLYQQYSKTYALDLFAGGYPYANRYINSVSPHTYYIRETMEGLQNGTIVPGGG